MQQLGSRRLITLLQQLLGLWVCVMLSQICPTLARANGQIVGRSCRVLYDKKVCFVRVSASPSRGYASTTALRLNRLLFEPHEVTVEGDACVAVLPLKDHRAAHVRDILKSQDGDTLRVGVLDAGRNDAAVMEWTNDKSLRIVLGPEATMLQPVADNERPRLDVLLAMQAPLRLERMLPQMASLGVDRIVLCGGNKVTTAYWGSHLLRKPEQLRACLLEGLTACGDTAVPRVTTQRRLKLLLRDECPVLFPRESTIYAVAHPFRPNPTPEQLLHNYDTRIRDLPPPPACGLGTPARMVLAIGPESGWEEPYELEMFKEFGFTQVSMGNRVLRTETAVPSLLALAHDHLHALNSQPQAKQPQP